MEDIAFTLQESCDGFATGLWGDYLFIEWRQAITMATLQRFEKLLEQFPVHPSRTAYRGIMVLVYDVSAVPPSDVREAMAAAMKKRSHITRSIAMVYEADGLRATVLRSLSAAITLMARQSAPTRVFSNVASAAEWQANYHGNPNLAGSLRQGMEQVRHLGLEVSNKRVG